jgi:hypothetical protein
MGPGGQVGATDELQPPCWRPAGRTEPGGRIQTPERAPLAPGEGFNHHWLQGSPELAGPQWLLGGGPVHPKGC